MIKQRLEHLEQRYPYFRKIYTAAGLQMAERILRIALGILVQAMLARHLGPEHYGKLSYITKYIGIFGTLLVFGMDELIIRDLVLHRDSKDSHPRLMTLLVTKYCLAFVAYAALMVSVLIIQPQEPLYTLLILIYGLSFFVDPLMIFEHHYTQNLHMQVGFKIRSQSNILSAVLKIGGALAKMTISYFMLVNLIEHVILAGRFTYAYFKEGFSKDWQFMGTYARRMLKTAAPLFLASFLMVFDQRFSMVLLEKLSDLKALGYFSISQAIVDILQFIPIAVSTSVFPSLISSHANDKDQFYRRLEFYVGILIWLALGLLAGAWLVGEFALPLLFGEKYPDLPHVLLWGLTANLFYFFNIARLRWFTLEHKIKTWMFLQMIAIPTSIYLQTLWIPTHQAIGAFQAFCVAQIFASLVMSFISAEVRKSIWLFIKSPLLPFKLYKQL